MKHSNLQCPDEKGKVCNNCRMREWRKNNPEMDAFRNLKTSARKRKLPFTITFKYFLKLIEGTGYIEKKGNGPENLTIDRENNLKGYVPGNCKVMKKSHNVTKFHYLDPKRKTKKRKNKKLKLNDNNTSNNSFNDKLLCSRTISC